MIPRVLLDTGPLVALLESDDHWHEACVTQLQSITPPLITTWPVLTEACWLLRSQPEDIQQMIVWISSRTITLSSLGDEAGPWIGGFLRKYRKIGPQIADASLVYLAERHELDTVFTLDRRNFGVYRYGRNKRFRLLPE